jgi:succinate dehydrogenase / fumarate reductase, cytochrome b subunit
MQRAAGLFRTTIGKKALMAATGVLLFGFVLGHMAGNLKLYQGRYAEGPHAGQWKIDVYGEGLRDFGAPILGRGQALWAARLALLAAVGLHVWAAASLTLQSRAARPIPYAVRGVVQADYAVRTMRWGGVILFLFVAYHLADLTFGWAHPEFVAGAVHDNVVASFRRPPVAALYIAANFALGLHLYHGLWSFFRSLGWGHPRFDPWCRRFAATFAVLVTAGNVSFPVAVWTGVVS